MRHGNRNRKLSKPTDQRLAMLRSIVRSLLQHGKVEVTVTRAKEARKMAERIITLSKYGDIASRRKAFATLRDRDLVKRVFTELSVRYEGRAGGYTRIIKIGVDRGDNAPKASLELV
ncbi:MAG: 50S ribosomal protein L17 [bacterium]